jgi:plastocyanin/mono/diheme cytochrome c family protein
VSDTPGGEPEERLPIVRPPAEAAPIERFTSPPSVRAVELTPERAAQVVRQSSNARWVGFLGVVVVTLFVAIYWFYELAPLGVTQSRLDSEAAAQQVTSVERGYNLYEANCARCHGPSGLGPNDTPPGIGPALNRQDKLFAHLSVDYLDNMLTVGGRYACGNPNSIMPVWSNEGHPPGPLNYIQIEDLIAFIRAPSTETYVIRDPSLFEPKKDPITGAIETFKGWRDPNYKPAPGATPYPACWANEFSSASSAPSGSAAPAGSPAASTDANAAHVKIVASGIAFTTTTVTAPTDKPFVIDFDNEDASTPHNVEIKDSSGQVKFKGDIFNGVATKEYQVPALPAGTYPFTCIVHPTMTGTVTVQ